MLSYRKEERFLPEQKKSYQTFACFNQYSMICFGNLPCNFVFEAKHTMSLTFHVAFQEKIIS